jgi:GTP 3',8-cyclase
MSMLLDTLGRTLADLRISLVDRCNFRCPYCMPEANYPRDFGMPDSARLSFTEIVRLAGCFHQLGVRKFRLTGGEPLLRKNLPELIHALKALGSEVVLTTNASLLAPHAKAMKDAGLDRLTVSLDSLDPDRFQRMSGGRGKLADVLSGIASAEAAGFTKIKFNCVVQRGQNEADVLALAQHFRHSGHVLRFIEYMDVGSCNGWQPSAVVSSAEILALIQPHFPLTHVPAMHASETAQRYAFDDGSGEIGIIASVSQPFCGSCTRARISADGKLFLCLFSHQGFDLRAPLRDTSQSDADISALIQSIWRARTDRYSAERAQSINVKLPQNDRRSEKSGSDKKRIEMYQIGG